MRRRRVTLSQIAAELNVSTATVSLALRDNPAVSSETRQRVRERAADLGYIYNRQAASLRTARTNIIGVVVNDVINPYFAEVFRAVENELEREGVTILICNHRDDLARQQTFVSVLQQQNADGLVICPSLGTTAADIEQITRSGTPVTLICRDVEGATVPIVRGDDFKGTYDLTTHLISLGHKHIAMIGGRRKTSSGRDRYGGFLAAMEQAGLSVSETSDVPEIMTSAEGKAAVERLLLADPRPTAIVCFNDLLAIGVMSGLYRNKLRPGIDIAVTGFDDVDGSETWTPSLTTVRNGSDEIGRQAASAIMALVNDRPLPFDRLLIPPKLEIRESSPPPSPERKAS
ncbi:Degradation activator [Hartmannibacter diazotrophicus]|uniref:Degradation activator n=1 Tax=Hartmannibacter diazotrophicus TaxID=1482074 RepID=A0A2C9DBN1_9HYPH|nr:LacI family DNA-binding transcriptional regulator [Hartmannibacter diazotrophicus]SON57643.1 Degradation activator [Hartmannibacter diazotrophicus]